MIYHDPDDFKVGISECVVNGDVNLPSTDKQGILKTEKAFADVNYRGFIIQWFYPANKNATMLADMYFRKANVASNTWSAFKKLTGV
jgi:hypothetical protein